MKQFSLLPRQKNYNRSLVCHLIRAFALTKHSGNPKVVRNLARRMEAELCGNFMLTEATYHQFSKWCHTACSYSEGMAIARAISLVVFGRVIERFDVPNLAEAR